jgi:hypothetical protein
VPLATNALPSSRATPPQLNQEELDWWLQRAAAQRCHRQPPWPCRPLARLPSKTCARSSVPGDELDQPFSVGLPSVAPIWLDPYPIFLYFSWIRAAVSITAHARGEPTLHASGFVSSPLYIHEEATVSIAWKPTGNHDVASDRVSPRVRGAPYLVSLRAKVTEN